jgi:hypothetical protein
VPTVLRAVHALAPNGRICFNTIPADTAEAVGAALDRAVSTMNLPSGDRIDRRKPELARAGAGVEPFLREDVLSGRMDVAQASLQR